MLRQIFDWAKRREELADELSDACEKLIEMRAALSELALEATEDAKAKKRYDALSQEVEALAKKVELLELAEEEANHKYEEQLDVEERAEVAEAMKETRQLRKKIFANAQEIDEALRGLHALMTAHTALLDQYAGAQRRCGMTSPSGRTLRNRLGRNFSWVIKHHAPDLFRHLGLRTHSSQRHWQPLTKLYEGVL
jgi:DNA repair exonuclease SbcCD ATPase subunit